MFQLQKYPHCPAKPSLHSWGVRHTYIGVLTSLNKLQFRMDISAVTRDYTPGSCRNSRKPIGLPRCHDMRPDSPALHAEQLCFPNQTRKEPRVA